MKGSFGRPIEIGRSISSGTFGQSEQCPDRAAKTSGPNIHIDLSRPRGRQAVSKAFVRFSGAVVPQVKWR